MFKRIAYLFILIVLILSLIEGVRFSVAENILYPIFYNLGLSGNDAKTLIISGKIKHYAMDYKGAEKVYIHVIKNKNLAQQRNALEQAYLGLGNSFYKEADYANAAKSYYLALKKNPGNREALLKYVRINMAYGNYEQIIPTIQLFISKKHDNPVGYTELCAVQNRLGNLSSARVNCAIAFKYSKSYARTHYDYYEVLNNIGFKQEAEEELILAKKLQPNIKSREELEEILRSVKKKGSKTSG